MTIWVDADACPRAIKEILYRAAERARVRVTLVANQPLQTPRSPFINSVQVPRGFDEADHRIGQPATQGLATRCLRQHIAPAGGTFLY